MANEAEVKEALKVKLMNGTMSAEEAKAKLQAFRDMQTPEEMPEGGMFSAVYEPAKAIGSSVAGQVVAGGAGLLELVKGQGLEEATKAIESKQESFAEFGAPKTQAGVKSLETVGDIIDLGIDVARIPLSGLGGIVELVGGQGIEQAAETVKNINEKGVGVTAGERVLEETGSPLMATVAYMTPEIAGSIVPVKFFKDKRSKFQMEMGEKLRQTSANPQLAQDISVISNGLRTGELGDDAIRQLDMLAGQSPKRIADQLTDVSDDIKAGVTGPSVTNRLESIAQETGQTTADTTLVRYIQDGAGKAKKDRLAIKAIEQGFDEGVIASVKGATDADRLKMQQMVDILERGKREALYGVKNRPSDIAGQSLLDRVRHVKQVNRQAGSELDGIAKRLKGQGADFQPAIDGFMSRLDDMGVSFDDNLNLRFQGSDIEGATAAENVLRKVVDRMKSGETGAMPDAYDMHRLKKYIDEQVTYGKSAEGLAGDSERVLKSLRRDLDSALDAQFPEYNRVNTTYADTVNALDSLQQVAGRKADMFGINADKDLGVLLRRLMSNARSRVNLMDSVDELESVARRYGGVFDDDVSVQMLFADELDSVFKPSARTGFQSGIGEGVKQGIEAATGQKTGLGMLAEAGGKMADRVKGINEENALLSIRELLARQ
ncbi:MAG: hypothetical protein HRU12_12675 [Phaeodactylibacter sp.]|nr:hypothetical protein [Phaeodactylibacter sp.]